MCILFLDYNGWGCSRCWAALVMSLRLSFWVLFSICSRYLQVLISLDCRPSHTLNHLTFKTKFQQILVLLKLNITMAEALADVECEFCCCKSDTIINPKVLECSHVHCMACLTTYYESKHLLLCGHSGCGLVMVYSISNCFSTTRR